MAAIEVTMPGMVVWEAINGVVYVQGTTTVIPYDSVQQGRNQALQNEKSAETRVLQAQDEFDTAVKAREAWDNLLQSATP